MMTEFNEMNGTKGECDASRRKLLKTTAMVAGVATISPAITLASGKTGETTLIDKSSAQVISDHHQHIMSVLNKYAAKSARVTAEHIDRFATGFIEMNGDIDYKETFKNLDGEYRLVKLFIKSLNAST
jgi:hypothetical protein